MLLVALSFVLAAAGLPALQALIGRTERGSGRRMLLATSAVHVSNDACFSIMYPLLPFIAADFGLSYAQVGLVKSVFSGASSALQIPAGVLGERLGEYLVLLLGNLWVGAGLGVMALAPAFGVLLAAACLAGLGGNAQHPLAPSLVARAYDRDRTRLSTALGTLNFSGDLGKLVGPVAVGLAAPIWGWQAVLAAVGAVTAVLSLGLLWRRHEIEAGPASAGEVAALETERGEGNRFGFGMVLLAGGLDNATRSAALTFLPFFFADRGLDATAVSFLLGVILAGGAAGKFVCGWLNDQLGTLATIVLTELVTAGALALFLVAPALAVAPLAVVFGFALNGTSSAFNTAVARLSPAHRRARAYGAYFTAALLSSSISPLLYGALGDAVGLAPALLTLAGATLLVVPAVLPIRAALATR